jgi:hypothetical protein
VSTAYFGAWHKHRYNAILCGCLLPVSRDWRPTRRTPYKIRVIRGSLFSKFVSIRVNSWFNGGEGVHLRGIFHPKSSYFFTRIHITP